MITEQQSSGRVLLVEDDTGTRYVVATQLRNAGFKVDEAASGEEGLQLARREHEVMILDIKLPGMSGWDVCRAIKDNPLTSRTIVLALSAALVTKQDRLEGLARGADAYLVHPVEWQELVATVRALVRLRRANDENDLQRELFVATIGHDLRSPLSSITMATSLLRMGQLGTRESSAVDKIERASARMKSLIEQLLILTQTLTGRQERRNVPVDLRDLTLRVFSERAGEQERLLVEGDARVSGEPVALAQLLDNLVGNALRHGEGPVTVRLAQAGEGATIAVHNLGRPVPEEARAGLFQPFKDASRASGGFGLGLFIVQRIAEHHGGTVALTSSDERGTTFTVSLPG